MMSNMDRLVYMANQIARNLTAQDPELACAATADHIASFWDPRMRALIFDHLEKGGEGLSEMALAAIRQLHDAGPPAHVTRATQFNHVDESGHSDAG